MDGSLEGPAEEGAEEAGFREDYDESTEVRFFLGDPSLLEPVFQDLCSCAALNPDGSEDSGDEDGGLFYDEAEVMAGAGAEERAAALARLEGLLSLGEDGEEEEDGDFAADDEDDQFEDAPE